MVHSRLNSNVKLSSQINFLGFDDTSIEENSDTSDVTGLARTRQKPEPDYFLQTGTRLFNINRNQTRTSICDETKCKNPTKTRT